MYQRLLTIYINSKIYVLYVCTYSYNNSIRIVKKINYSFSGNILFYLYYYIQGVPEQV